MSQSTERVAVHLRIRPVVEGREDEKSGFESVTTAPPQVVVKKEFTAKAFLLSSVLEENASQEEVYERTASDIVTGVLEGFHGAVIAYGQTGSGKTYTMLGDSENRGIIPRALEAVLSSMAQDRNSSYTVSLAFVQIYMEVLQDLLYPENRNVKVREDTADGSHLVGVTWRTVHSLQDCIDTIEQGSRARATAATGMNDLSSRSHAVLLVRVERRPPRGEERGPEQVATSTLHLVDLAGSERPTAFASGRMDESKTIGLALLALGNCIKALADKKAKHVPYRDSVLTRLLSNSLGGNCRTAIILTASPSVNHISETLQTLTFGSFAMKVETHPAVSKRIDYKVLCSKLQAELEQSKERYNALAAANGKLETCLKQMKSELASYSTEKSALEDSISVKIAKELKANYEAKLREKDQLHTKLLVDFNQYVSAKELEVEMIRRENATYCEALKTVKEQRFTVKCEGETCSHEQEVVEITAMLESARGALETKEGQILALEERIDLQESSIQQLQKALEVVKRRSDSAGSSPDKGENSAKAGKLEDTIAQLQSQTITLAARLKETELTYSEKCEETELLRAELIRRDSKRPKHSVSDMRKGLDSETQARKALELQVAQLQWQLTNAEKGDRTHLKFVRALLYGVKDLAAYSSLESKLLRIIRPGGEPSVDSIATFAADFNRTMNPEDKGLIAELTESKRALEDQLAIAAQLYASQREKADILVREM